jgi:hypothetical protein
VIGSHLKHAFVATLLTLLPAGAQWLDYPTAGVPRTPSGFINLGAPTPRTADGKPELSGIWQADNTRPCPPEGCADMRTAEEFFDFGARLKGGLPYQPWALTLMKARSEQLGKDDHETQCLPSGVPRLNVHPTLRKYLQAPGLLIVLSERNTTFRQIFSEGRVLPSDPQPSWNGYSSGRWEGDTLVVQTIGLRDRLWLDRNGSPLTDAAKVIERFHRINYGNMEIEVTIDDPKAYTKPFTVKLNQFIVLNTELLDDVCAENEKDASHMVGK